MQHSAIEALAAAAGGSAVTAQLGQVMGAVETVRDVSSWVGKRPDPSPAFPYAETRAFDMQLHSSLNAALPAANVQVGGQFKRNAVPERMGQWIDQLKRSGGTVRSCAEESRTRSFFVLLSLALSVAKQTDRWVLYRPVGGYDATLLLTPKSEVKNVVFTHRGAVTACPAGTFEVKG